jgi:autotransporter-associated beta strand protein
MPVWSKFLEYPFDFPSEPNYVVGQSRWTTDWNFTQPIVVDAAGNYNGSTSTITFNLPSAPGASASLYFALSSDYQGPLIVRVNGVDIAGSTGYFPSYSSSGDQSDATIREGIHGTFSDNRINFAGSMLNVGQNTITINMRKGGNFANHAMYDYVRLELSGYIPPTPSNVTAYAGNGRNLISWPCQSGATGYNILRSTTSGSGYVSITNGVVGPVCGSGYNNATYTDASVVNGTTYYYVVQSVNTAGSSTNSPQSSGVTPSVAISSIAPAAPATTTIGGISHQSVTVNWSASTGANYYTVYRSTMFDNGGGASNVLGTIVLNNTNTTTSFTDTAVTDGTIYRYSVTATSAAGTSTNSPSASGVPLPVAPAVAPGSFSGLFNGANIVLNWTSVPNAVGYIVRRGTSSGGPFVYVQNITETVFYDTGLTLGNTYYYQVTAVNAAGVSPAASATVVPPPLAPVSLSAYPGNGQVTLSWTPVPGVTGYYLFSGTNSGNETNVVLANYNGTNYINTGLSNGTPYFYVVASTNSTGLSPNSPEASATPDTNIVTTPRSLIWNGDGVANVWDSSGNTNWQTNGVDTIFNNGDTVTFDNTGSNNVPIYLAGTPQPALVTINSTKNYTLGGVGSIAGTNKFIKTGSGTLTINNTNYFSGGITISNSTVYPGNIGANSAGWGNGPITLAGGTVQFFGYAGSLSTGFGGLTNAINVPVGQSGSILLPPRWGYSSPFSSPLIGGGTLNVTVDYVRNYFSGNWSAFTGKINVTPRSGTGDFRIDNPNGYANAAIILNGSANLYNVNANSQTTDIGELGGGTNSFIGSGSLSSLNPTWRIGAKNTTNTYAGVIADAGVTSLIKTGTGMLVLANGSSTYSGGTTVNGGILMVSNTTGTATGTGNVAVNSTGTLAGAGIISGAVSVNLGGTIAPGPTSGFGTMTLSNNLTLSGGSTTLIQLRHSPRTNDSALISGTLTEAGTLKVVDAGVGGFAAGDSFKLFTAGSISGAFTSYIMPTLTGNLGWNTSALKTTGTLSIIALTSPKIANLQFSGANVIISGTNGVNSWPYVVQATTNQLPVQWFNLLTNQFDTSGNFTTILSNAYDKNHPFTFFRLQLQ